MNGTDAPERVRTLASERLLSAILGEARRRYAEERQRSRTAESKIGTVITIDALIITLVGVVSTLGGSVGPVSAVAATLALVSTGVGVSALRVRPYRVPGRHVGDYYQYIERDTLAFSDHFLNNYIEMTELTAAHNARKFVAFKRAIGLTTAALVLVTVEAVLVLLL